MARGPRPTADFARVTLDLATVAAGQVFGRLYAKRHPDPLGFGLGKTRYSDPRRRKEANRFGVIYLGASLKVCFLEGLLRDERNGLIGDYPLDEAELDARWFAWIETLHPLQLVDFRGDSPVRMGIPSDAVRASEQSLARQWSVAIHEHPQRPDGIIFPSRLNGEINLAIYDRAIVKLGLKSKSSLRSTRGLASVLNELLVAIVP